MKRCCVRLGIFLFFLVFTAASFPRAEELLLPQSQSRITGPKQEAMGVCPPFKLRDEEGNIIDPVHGVNDRVPYSPRQTCGAAGCHDYKLITEGYHFTQGKSEPLPAEFASRYNWVTSPGNYGGNWCSPAPLYRQLAPKVNTTARIIDMTSFDFVIATCGNCHPGGGPLEFDREGFRYDKYMKDRGMIAGGENGLDGDYFKARWSETGVIEADCLMCHMPEYRYKERNAHLNNLNFRWAASVGAGFATVTGKVAAGESPWLQYNRDRFDEEGNVMLHLAPEPRNENCLNCHAKPGWKKRGASFSPRTDVHIVAGMRCVDCHPSGSKAVDPRIKKREVHQIGKGDDPSGWVRNDLDNTMRDCETCHVKGWRNAPLAQHEWLAPLHLEKISCETCHIPTRAVKSALVQASDVFNPAPRISPPPKHIWTFYDQGMRFWNHYGELDLFTVQDQPTDISRPTLVRYKGKIYPANRVHSTWVGYEEEGKRGLNQLFMRDFFTMWIQHRSDPAQFPRLSRITDDNDDGIIEVNRPEEIDALLAATKEYLIKTGFPLEGKRLVWVSDSRVYYSSLQFKELEHKEYEATPYASVYKYSHDVAPARAALGAGGCTDCHRFGSHFFWGKVLDLPFSEDGSPRWIPAYRILGFSPFWVYLGAIREEWVKPILYGLLALLGITLAACGVRELFLRRMSLPLFKAALLSWLFLGAGVALAIVASLSPQLVRCMTFSRFTLDANHFWIAIGVLVLGILISTQKPIGGLRMRKIFGALMKTEWGIVILVFLCGGAMIVKFPGFGTINRLAYTVFDIGITALTLVSIIILILRLFTISEAVVSEK